MKYRQARHDEPLIQELAGDIARACRPAPDRMGIPAGMLRESAPSIPCLSERRVVQHYHRLSQMNYGVDTGFYPLGSCTMKYNPKVCDKIAGMDGFAGIHPLQDESTCQGTLQIMHELQELLCDIAGVDAASLQPAAGAHGEYLGILLVRAYQEGNGGAMRDEIILPDTAHGTNPASAAMAGYKVIELKSADGRVDLDALRNAVSEKTAALMLTNPNTLGIFESEVKEMASIVHEAGGLLYYDGANLNAIMGRAKPGLMGFDIVHFNLHKTFATPHGGGGPGSGPVGVVEKLAPYLPVPVVGYREEDKQYYLDYSRPSSIGKVRAFYGNVGVLIRAYAYIRMMGAGGLKEASDFAVLNSNYLKALLEKLGFEVPYSGLRKHEFVMSGSLFKDRGYRTLDAAKHLLDHGIHAPTVYFPLIVEEAMMIEPTETETKETLDRFADILEKMLAEDAEHVKGAPYYTAARRIDEVEAAKRLAVSYKDLRGP